MVGVVIGNSSCRIVKQVSASKLDEFSPAPVPIPASMGA